MNFRLLNTPDSALALIKAKTEECHNFSKIVRNRIKNLSEENKNNEPEQEIIDDVTSIQKSIEYLQNYITALIAKNDLSNEQAVECEEQIIILHKTEKKLKKTLEKYN